MDSDFELLFRRQGIVKFTYHPETLTDPQVLAQRWCHPPTGGEYLIDKFYRLFGKNDFRKVLRRIYTAESGVARDRLAENCGDVQLHEYLAFLSHQELAVEQDGLVYKHPRYRTVSGIGRTLEWYVARWFQEFLQCPARYKIHIPDMGDSGDLDVVTFLEGMFIWAECKSGRHITDAQLQRFRERAQAYTPVMAILLIDTDDKKAIQRYVERLNNLDDLVNTLGEPLYPLEVKNQREWLYWRGRAMYVVGAPNSIEESLVAALRLYQGYVKFVPFVG